MDPALTPQRVIEDLEQEGLDEEQGTAVWHRIWYQTPMRSLVGALRIAEDPDTRRAVLDLLGFRNARSAIPDMIAHLDDPDVYVRGAAADALGKAFGYLDRPPPTGYATGSPPFGADGNWNRTSTCAAPFSAGLLWSATHRCGPF